MPILLSLGPIKIYSYGVCVAIGIFLSLYFWWKMGRDEHWDEIALFDGYFLSLITFLLVGRMAYVAMHYSELGTLYRLLAILAFPGINGVVGMMGASVAMILFARSYEWQIWKVMDTYVVATVTGLIFSGIGMILNGINPVWQANVWVAVWALITFGVVSRVRKDFRFYSWYKGLASVAQEGLATLIFVGMVGIYYLGVKQYLVGVALIFVSGLLIYKSVGRRDSSMWSKLVSILRRK